MRRGIALVVSLIISFIALTLIGALYYLMTSGTQVSGFHKTYLNSEQVAKGVSVYLFRLMESGDFCRYTDCNSANATINLGNFSDIDNFNVNATLLYRTVEGSSANGPQIYAVELKVTNKKNPSDKVVVDFVYKIY